MRFFLSLYVAAIAVAFGGKASLYPPATAFVVPRTERPASFSCIPRIAPSLVHQHGTENNRKCETSLSMGLRSFFGKKMLGRKDDEGAEEETDEETPVAPSEEIVMMDETPGNGGGEETTQDRINRLKSGRMTDEEKAAFLRTTLSATGTSEPAGSKKPLRQQIPSPSDPAMNDIKETASPFPKDTILKSTFSRRGSQSYERPRAPISPELDTDKKKRDYLAMVTNPNRFNSYKTPTMTDEPSVPIDSFMDDEEGAETPDEQDAEALPSSPPIGSNDLASRLEAAASAEEVRKRDSLRQQEEAREKRMQKITEMQRVRNEEIAKREAEALERKRRAEEAKRKEEEDRLRAEEDQKQKMMQAQEAYWTKKLEEENEARRQRLMAEEDEKKKATEREVAHQKALELNQEQERLRQEAEQKQMEAPAAEEQATAPPGEVSVASFLREQAIQKSKIDEARDQQLEQLKSLNSPLPRPTPAVPAPAPVMQQGIVTPPSGGRLQKPPGQKPRAKTVSEVMAEIEDEDDDALIEDEADSSVNKGSSLGRLGRLLGNNQNNQTERAPIRQQAPDVAPKKTAPIRQQIPSSAPKEAAVRQQIPLGELTRKSPDKKAAQVGDKATDNPEDRSKKWGIDMSKFSGD